MFIKTLLFLAAIPFLSLADHCRVTVWAIAAHEKILSPVAFSQDGTHVARVEKRDGAVEIVVRATDSQTVVGRLEVKQPTQHRLHFSPDGKYLAIQKLSGNEVVLWEVGTDMTKSVGGAKRIEQAVFVPGKGQIVFLQDGEVRSDGFCESCRADLKFVGRNGLSTQRFRSLRVSARGSVAACDDFTGVVAKWDSPGGENSWAYEANAAVNAFDFSPDGSKIALALKRGGVEIHTPNGGKLFYEIETASVATAMRFSPDGTKIALVSSDDIFLLSTETRRKESIRVDRATGIIAPVFSADGKNLAVAIGGRSIVTLAEAEYDPTKGHFRARAAVEKSPEVPCRYERGIALLDTATLDVVAIDEGQPLLVSGAQFLGPSLYYSTAGNELFRLTH